MVHQRIIIFAKTYLLRMKYNNPKFQDEILFLRVWCNLDESNPNHWTMRYKIQAQGGRNKANQIPVKEQRSLKKVKKRVVVVVTYAIIMNMIICNNNDDVISVE